MHVNQKVVSDEKDSVCTHTKLCRIGWGRASREKTKRHLNLAGG